jgi:conjugal transfer pilus assembly protein TraB
MAGKLSKKIPLYNQMTPKRRQQLHMLLGGLAVLTVVMIASGLISGPATISAAGGVELPKPKPLSSVAGAQLEARDAWMGDAGKQVAKLTDELRSKENVLQRMQDDQRRDREALMAQVNELRQRMQMPPVLPAAAGVPVSPAAAPVQGVAPQPAPADGAANRSKSAAGPSAAAVGSSAPANQAGHVTGAEVFPSQPRGDRIPATAAQGTYPPGVPNAYGVRPAQGAPTQAVAVNPVAPPSVLRVSLVQPGQAGAADGASNASATGATASAGTGGATKSPKRHVSQFLPVGFTKAVLLGGVAAPTGGQAQSNPVPILLRLTDLSVLPNGFRAMVKDCLVVGEAYGDHSAERAYGRTTLLSCVTRNGDVLEVPIKGSVFGEDGMNGIKGPLVTKQGQILTNALLAGIASGLGQSIAQASQSVTSTALGQVTASPTDSMGILRGGVGTGVGKALDRLATYYINLAEKTFPVIEVQAGRQVDVVITQGVPLDVALESVAQRPDNGGPVRRGETRAALMQALRTANRSGEDSDDE